MVRRIRHLGELPADVAAITLAIRAQIGVHEPAPMTRRDLGRREGLGPRAPAELALTRHPEVADPVGFPAGRHQVPLALELERPDRATCHSPLWRPRTARPGARLKRSS